MLQLNHNQSFLCFKISHLWCLSGRVLYCPGNWAMSQKLKLFKVYFPISLVHFSLYSDLRGQLQFAVVRLHRQGQGPEPETLTLLTTPGRWWLPLYFRDPERIANNGSEWRGRWPVTGGLQVLPQLICPLTASCLNCGGFEMMVEWTMSREQRADRADTGEQDSHVTGAWSRDTDWAAIGEMWRGTGPRCLGPVRHS